jgi:hypothetical protein
MAQLECAGEPPPQEAVSAIHNHFGINTGFQKQGTGDVPIELGFSDLNPEMVGNPNRLNRKPISDAGPDQP